MHVIFFKVIVYLLHTPNVRFGSILFWNIIIDNLLNVSNSLHLVYWLFNYFLCNSFLCNNFLNNNFIVVLNNCYFEGQQSRKEEVYSGKGVRLK